MFMSKGKQVQSFEVVVLAGNPGTVLGVFHQTYQRWVAGRLIDRLALRGTIAVVEERTVTLSA
jgi:hypothetical protein